MLVFFVFVFVFFLVFSLHPQLLLDSSIYSILLLIYLCPLGYSTIVSINSLLDGHPDNSRGELEGGNRIPVCMRIINSLSNRKYAPQSKNAIHQQSTRQLPITTPSNACIIIIVDAAPARPSLPLQYAKVEHPSRDL